MTKIELYDSNSYPVGSAGAYPRFEVYDADSILISTGGGVNKFEVYDENDQRVLTSVPAPDLVGWWSPDFIQ